MTQKGVKFTWFDECEQNFQALKDWLVPALILTKPTSSRGYVVYSNASLRGLGCVLMQNGKVIAHASHQVKPHEQALPYSWSRVGSSNLHFEDLEALFVWWKVLVHLEGAQCET